MQRNHHFQIDQIGIFVTINNNSLPNSYSSNQLGSEKQAFFSFCVIGFIFTDVPLNFAMNHAQKPPSDTPPLNA